MALFWKEKVETSWPAEKLHACEEQSDGLKNMLWMLPSIEMVIKDRMLSTF